MLVWRWVQHGIGGGVGIWAASGGRWHVGVAVGLTAMAGIALAATLVVSSSRGSLKSPWSRRKQKHALSHRQWTSLFTPDGKLRDGGAKFLKKARSGGIDPSIRAEVWPFLLGVYDLNSTEDERNMIKRKKRAEYERLKRRCRKLLNHRDKINLSKVACESSKRASSPSSDPTLDSEEELTTRADGEESGDEEDLPKFDSTPERSSECEEEEEEQGTSGITHIDDTESESSMEREARVVLDDEAMLWSNRRCENFATWQRIIRLDAVRANAEWVIYYPDRALVTGEKANQSAVAVGLSDYDHLEPCMIRHAARLVAVLEAYALYDPEIGYCQGMSDLLSPILAVMEEDDEAFWCFVGFMRKARHNFRLDEAGIRRQLGIVAKIIKSKDLHLYRHLEKLQAGDCFFVYRMVVVLFRRELSFEQTVCLWEVMWADQAAIRAGIGKSTWGRIRLRAPPPTDDLLLYAIAACVLQRRKLIVEKYSSMDEIMRECNDMAGSLDVWKLLDDAHDLVVSLHDKV